MESGFAEPAPLVCDVLGPSDYPAEQSPSRLRVSLPVHGEASFDSLEEARKAVDAVARVNGYGLVILRSYKEGGEKTFVELACDRHGLPSKYNPKPGVKRRKRRATRKCNCPMRIYLVWSSGSKQWHIEHRNQASEHNHNKTKSSSSHPVHRRADLTPDVVAQISADARTGVRPGQTLARLVAEKPGISLIVEDIYNAKRKAKFDMLRGKSRMEYVLDQLSTDKYFSEYQVDSVNRLTHLFLAFKPAIQIYKQNPDVLQMDCTYKSNYFKMPLLNIVGVTGMNTTIHVAQAFLREEKQPDYHFALEQLRKMIEQYDIQLPQVILVDCELALLNALESVFPSVPVLLCQWHVEKNVEKHAREGALPKIRDEEASTSTKEIKKDSPQHETFCKTFRKLIVSRTQDEYAIRLNDLRSLCLQEAQYVEFTWLDIWKYHIVHCWTKVAVHFGQHATSRVEGYHRTFKEWINNSEGDFLTIYERMTTWWQMSIRRHEFLRDKSIVKSLRVIDDDRFRNLHGVIHSHALELCYEETRRIRPGFCTGVFMHTMGMPCYHVLKECEEKNKRLKPSDFHAHWWIDRMNADPARAPVPLAPLRIADRRANRAATKKRKHSKGSGIRGTRREPSGFEMPPLEQALERTQQTPYKIAQLFN